jgi:hypothetical protein
MYVRFTIPSDTNRPRGSVATGIIHAAWRLAEDHRFAPWAYELLREHIDWYNAHVPVPRDIRLGRAICWFRPEAREAISRAWQIAELVEAIGVSVRVYRKQRPGTIVYEDAFQVTALPWQTTFVR